MRTRGQPEPGRLDIRKYANRRFYDATRSKHITQEEIHQFIRNGHEVRVTDAKTGEDITVRVLAQIILDMDEPKLAVFPVELLHRLIQSNETLMRDFVEKYFSQALMLFLESRKKFEEQLRSATGLGIVPPQAMDWARLMGTPFLSPLATNAGHPATAGAERAPGTHERTQELERAVRELQEQVQSLQGKHPRGNGRSRKKTTRRPAQRE
jgi:polyhydroxyalkanoate synthesis repressor PhaR